MEKKDYIIDDEEKKGMSETEKNLNLHTSLGISDSRVLVIKSYYCNICTNSYSSYRLLKTIEKDSRLNSYEKMFMIFTVGCFTGAKKAKLKFTKGILQDLIISLER